MIDTTQSQADIDDQFWSIVANETSRGSNDGARVNVSTEAWRAYEERLALGQLVEHHLSDASIAGAASPNLIELTDPVTPPDPRFFNVAGARFVEPSASERGMGAQVSEVFQPQSKSLVEKQVEELPDKQKHAVIAEIAAYMVAIRSQKLRTLALMAAEKYRKER